ncbi:branched-chain amino acid ABC transporter permease [Candidatus Bathyarchaeota archaeon]|nr:branched-chain amino acid ABC transporter permease [Candidatus Bathyarchaeota archaeon]
MDPLLLSQYLFLGIIIGSTYCLMAIGITFIYGIMKMMNWAMGEFYMVGSYVQWFLVVKVFGSEKWFLGIPTSMIVVFLVGLAYYRLLLRPMFAGGVERRDDYVTIITIASVILFRNIAVVLYGPYVFSTPDYYPPVYFGTLPMSGSRFTAFVGTVLILGIFYYCVKRTWIGRAFQATAQNRIGVQIAGINPYTVDQIAFGMGVALAAAAGALLTPVYMVYPTNGAISTMKGFIIITLGGLGSIPGTIVGGILLGVVESLGSVLINPSYCDIYGFVVLVATLAIRPTGLFGEIKRIA